MSKENVYVLQDIKAGGYGTPVVAANDAMVCRIYGRCVANDVHSILSLYPQDFLIQHIGTFDATTGKLEAVPDARMVANLADVAAALKKDGV